jgi:ketosteroid isomerase-like protein
MGRLERLQSLFRSIDRKDVDAFLAFLSDEAVFRFGNGAPVRGKDLIREAVEGFFASIKAIRHDLRESWDAQDALVGHGMVTYTRHDSSTLTVPFAVVLGLKADRIDEYLIFADVSQLHGTA